MGVVQMQQFQLLCSMTHLWVITGRFPARWDQRRARLAPSHKISALASEWDRVPGCKEAGRKSAVRRLQKGSLRAWTLRRQRHSTSRGADLPNFYVLLQKEAFFSQHVISKRCQTENRFLKVQERQNVGTRLWPLQEKMLRCAEFDALSLPRLLGSLQRFERGPQILGNVWSDGRKERGKAWDDSAHPSFHFQKDW